MKSTILILTTVIAGCFPATWGQRVRPTSFSRRAHASYAGPECARAIVRKKMGHYPRTKQNASVAVQVLLHICRRVEIMRRDKNLQDYPLFSLIPAKRLHKMFSQRKLSPTAAALIVVGVYKRDLVKSHMRRDVGTGLAAFYATKVDPGAVANELGALGLSSKASAAFLHEYRTAKRAIDQRAAEFSPGARMVLIDLAEKVWKQRAHHFAAYAQSYAQLDAAHAQVEAALTDGALRRTLIRKLIALRSRFMARCGGTRCRKFPLYLIASEDLIALYVAAEDGPAAAAESGALRYMAPAFERRFAHALNAAKRRLAPALYARYRRYNRLIRSGTKPGRAAALAGKGLPIFRLSPDHILRVPDSRPIDGSSALVKKPKRFDGSVASVRRARGAITLRFRGSTKTNSVPYRCRRTNRISRIDRHGHVTYEEDCHYRKTITYIKPPPPVRLPRAEARRVRVGDEVRGYRDGRDGRVVMVVRHGKVVQLRRHAVVPFAAGKRRRYSLRW